MMHANGPPLARFFSDPYSLVRSTFFAPPGGFEPPTCDLGNRWSGQVFDQVTPGVSARLASVFPQPSQKCGSPSVYDGDPTGGDG